MSKTFNLAIPFDFLLQAIAKLSPADKLCLITHLHRHLARSADKDLDELET